jgi:hypothetical protein
VDKQKLDESRQLAHSMISHPVAYSTIDHVEQAGNTMVDLLAEVAKLRDALEKIEAGNCIDPRTVAREALGPNVRGNRPASAGPVD